MGGDVPELGRVAGDHPAHAGGHQQVRGTWWVREWCRGGAAGAVGLCHGVGRKNQVVGTK